MHLLLPTAIQCGVFRKKDSHSQQAELINLLAQNVIKTFSELIGSGRAFSIQIYDS